MKPKEILLRDGKISAITRGRISRENHLYLAELAKNGEKIDGYTAVESTNPKGERVVRNSNPTPGETPIYDITIRYDEREWEAYRFNDGKSVEVSMRTVCNTCGNSLTGHFCDEARVWVDHRTEAVVYFKPRKNPLPIKRW